MDRKKPLSELYDPAVIHEIVSGLKTADRWGVAEGQLAKASRIINSQIINTLVREYIDGERDASATADLINEEIAAVE